MPFKESEMCPFCEGVSTAVDSVTKKESTTTTTAHCEDCGAAWVTLLTKTDELEGE